MAEAEEDVGVARLALGDGSASTVDARRRLDPEKGPIGVVVLLQERAEKALEEHLADVVTCIVDNIRLKHLPSAKLLIDLATRVRGEDDVPEEDYRSFAEVLWKEVQEQEQGIGTRD